MSASRPVTATHSRAGVTGTPGGPRAAARGVRMWAECPQELGVWDASGWGSIRIMRRGVGGLLGLAMAMAVPGVADAQSTALPDVPVAACPAGATPVALRVIGGATGTWRLGPFAVRLTARGLRVASDARTLWSSAHGGFVAAGAGDPGIVGGRGGFYGGGSEFSD